MERSNRERHLSVQADRLACRGQALLHESTEALLCVPDLDAYLSLVADRLSLPLDGARGLVRGEPRAGGDDEADRGELCEAELERVGQAVLECSGCRLRGGSDWVSAPRADVGSDCVAESLWLVRRRTLGLDKGSHSLDEEVGDCLR
jgi:hypothetical protein